MELLATLNLDNATSQQIAGLKPRQAARAVIFNNHKQVAIVKVNKENYYKIPGGGLEPNETIEQALLRECQEEAGYSVKIDQPLGRIIEYRTQHGINQESYGFIAQTNGPLKEQHLTEEEASRDFRLIWLNLSEAISLLENNRPTNYSGTYMQTRDLLFLKQAFKIKNSLI
ncbi:NUDIX domain-containing protein [Patescibacteria group bacterium]|nr:NUDIX domain-containing protein [Patescibacteria group bacterium]